MTRRTLAPVLAATFLLVAVPPASAYTPVSEMKDLSPDHWAYGAIKQLVEKYQIMEGFPDSTFRGSRTLSRYELAAALAKVMARVEEMLSAATGEPSAPARVQPSVTADDLRLIARLQQEFKDELTLLKARFDGMDNRLAAVEKRIRLGGSLEALYRSYMVQPLKNQVTEQDNLRIATHLDLEANPSPDVAYRGEFAIFNQGVQSLANGHLATEGGIPTSSGYDVATPLYVRRSYFSWTPAGVGVHVGMMTFSDTLKVGSTLRNDFRTGPVWPNAEGGYGFVGTPPWQSPTTPGSAGQLVLSPANPIGPMPAPPGRVHWNAGLNVAEDLLDPNSVWSINTGSSPAAVIDGMLGPVELGVGMNYGAPGTSGATALADLPRTYPLVADFGNGYALGKVGLDLGIVRMGLFGRADNASLGQLTDFSTRLGKGWAASFDLGDDSAGLSLGYADMTRRAYDTNNYNEASAFLVSNNLVSTGIGAGLGVKLGNSPANDATSPLLGIMPYDWSSVGGYVRFSPFSLIPSLTFAAQLSGTTLATTDLGAGFSAIAEIQIPSMPALFVEYDQGHFYGTGSAPTSADADLNKFFGGTFATHEQLTLGTSAKF